MAVATHEFTTGPTTLPDIGELTYNGCKFGPLFETTVSGNPIKDKAKRTVMYMEYTLTVDGYVTLPSSENSINGPMNKLRELLTAQAGDLFYQGRGFNINANTADGDVAWGPVPELLDFQPLGAGKSAKVQWKVTVRITEPPFARISQGQNRITPMLQFNYDTSVTYGEDGYSTISMHGTMEIPMTRNPSQKTRTIPRTVDNFRGTVESRLMSGIDLSKFRLTRRDFRVSRDKRMLEWDITAEELPYMNMPPYCTVARGSYNVRPVKVGPGVTTWFCTLKATYTVGRPHSVGLNGARRQAWLAFLALLRLRMSQSERGEVDDSDKDPISIRNIARDFLTSGAIGGSIRTLLEINKKIKEPRSKSKALIWDFSIDEGLYLDSKTTSFSATWFIVTSIKHILLASGLWMKVVEESVNDAPITPGPKVGKNLWAISMRDVSGVYSWMPNILDNNLDAIVDFGGS